MHYSLQTNCISLSSNANVARTYGEAFSDKYVMIKKIMGNNYGTTIYVEEENGIYKVYKSPRNNGRLIYLFTTTDYKTMYFLNDYIYYKDGIYIKQYSDLTGTKTIIKDSEIQNKTVSFYIGENV